jgi:hypothetical protein
MSHADPTVQPTYNRVKFVGDDLNVSVELIYHMRDATAYWVSHTYGMAGSISRS